MWLLDEHEDGVLAAIDAGTLSLAWDIASPGAQRREVRVWVGALNAHLQRHPSRLPADLRPLIEGLLPRRDLLQREVQRIFSCSSTHITELLRAEALHLAAPKPARSSPIASTRILRASVVAFLERRRIL